MSFFSAFLTPILESSNIVWILFGDDFPNLKMIFRIWRWSQRKHRVISDDLHRFEILSVGLEVNVKIRICCDGRRSCQRQVFEKWRPWRMWNIRLTEMLCPWKTKFRVLLIGELLSLVCMFVCETFFSKKFNPETFCGEHATSSVNIRFVSDKILTSNWKSNWKRCWNNSDLQIQFSEVQIPGFSSKRYPNEVLFAMD